VVFRWSVHATLQVIPSEPKKINASGFH
jgi:hypothetical protein